MTPDEKDDAVAFTLRLPAPFAAGLEAAARARGISKAAVLRLALHAYLGGREA